MAKDIYSETDFNPEIAERICELYAQGLTGPGGQCARLNVTQICAEVDITIRTLRVWLARYPTFESSYRVARELYADRIMEEALEIADDTSNDTYVHTTAKGDFVLKQDWDNVNRAKLQVETRFKIASKLHPDRYGDKLQVNSTSTVVHIDETIEGKQLRVRNLIEEAKKQGYNIPEIMGKLGLSEVNLLPADFRPGVQDIPQRMLEEKMAFRVPQKQPKPRPNRVTDGLTVEQRKRQALSKGTPIEEAVHEEI